ncbi:MAG: hypothetical protein K0S53_3219 [Bacteroidetes bacterium]|jgi:hypothetical protein|nr:hypothetical protein [Bacteroidota bacterium]MDF2453264.1 hypothetical protein [Bacteroidota bacterium]
MSLLPGTIQQNEWKQCQTSVFWGEIAPTDHLVQIYENDDIVLASLEGFIVSGLKDNDAVIVIATAGHLTYLNERLTDLGYDVQKLKASNQYIPLNAHEALAEFMRDGWPNQELFLKMVNRVINEARGDAKRQVRAYGEMVAILWEQGHSGATVQLENMWHKFCLSEAFCLFCAYPKSGFTQDAQASIDHICATHSKIIGGLEKSKTEVFYRDSNCTKKVS